MQLSAGDGHRLEGRALRDPEVPTLLHVVALEAAIPPGDVAGVAVAHPDVVVHVYDGAERGFNSDLRGSRHDPSATLALKRTLAFGQEHGVA